MCVFFDALCFVMQYLVSFLVLQSSRWGRGKRADYFTIIALLMSCGCWFVSVFLPRAAIGLSSLCDFDISSSYSLTHLCAMYFPILIN